MNTNETEGWSLKKKADKRVRGGVSYETFLQMKADGEFEDFDLHSDNVLSAMFLQWTPQNISQSLWLIHTDVKFLRL